MDARTYCIRIPQSVPAGGPGRQCFLGTAGALAQHVQKARTAGGRRLARTVHCSRSLQSTTEAPPSKQLPKDSARRTVMMPPPPGAEANNAVTLHRRRQQRRIDDANTATLAAAAVEAAARQSAPAQEASETARRQPARAVNTQLQASAAPSAVAAGQPQGSLLGAVTLITGSTVGAGVLALPSVAAPAGFGPSTAALGVCWAMLAAQAMLLAEVNLGVTAMREQQDSNNSPAAAQQQMVTLRQMAEATLGRAGGATASSVYLLLSFSLLIAYIAKAGELMTSGSGLDPGLAGAGFTAALGGMMCFGGAAVADNVNRWLTGGLMLMFGGILAYGSGHADVHQLTATVDWQQAPAAVPIIFLALVYHDLVSVVCSQLGGDRRRVRVALLAGSLLPLAMFVSWDAIMLALTSEPGTESPADPLAVLIEDSGGAVGTAVQGFSLLALATSFIGTCTGLTSTLQSEYAAVTASSLEPVSAASAAAAHTSAEDGEAQAEHPAPQPLVYLVALVPPLGIALAHPGSFLTLLSAAGAYGMSLLYGVMPPLMAWQLRYNQKHDSSSRSSSSSSTNRSATHSSDNCSSRGARAEADIMSERGSWSDCSAQGWVPGGKAVLALLCASAVAVEAGQAALSLGH